MRVRDKVVRKEVQAFEDGGDHGRGGDHGDDPAPALTSGTGQDVKKEHPGEQFRPGVARGSCRRAVAIALHPPAATAVGREEGRRAFGLANDGTAERVVGRLDTVIGDELRPRRRNERGQAFEERERIEVEGVGAVTPGLVQPVGDAAAGLVA